MDTIEHLFGSGKDLTALQMSCRSVIMFIIALVCIRIAGTKTFGKNSAFDNIVIIMLGAILSRGVVGVSPFVPVVCSGLAMVIMTRFVSWITTRSSMLSRLIKGTPRSLYKQGTMNYPNLKKSLLSESDVKEGVRLGANLNTLEKVEEVRLECNGEISVIKKDIN